MTLNFPSSPSDQDVYSGYVYDATKGVWKKIAATTDNVSEGSTNVYFTNQRALDATASAYDAAGSAATAESNANTYTDGRETAITTAYQSYADTAEADAISTASADATSKANTAESNANTYTDGLVGDVTVDGSGGNTVTDRIASAVSGLVDSAPATLDTLNELAAALGDDPNFATTVATSIGEKVAKSGDTMTGDLTLAQDPTSNLHAATKQYVDTAESDANTYTDNAINALDTDDIEEGATNLYFTNQRAISAVGENLALDALSDVATSGVNDGDALVYDTATTSWVPGSVAIDALNDINDVTITTPADGQVLTYNSGTWENQNISIPESNPHPFTMLG